jgi:hypothetical protein
MLIEKLKYHRMVNWPICYKFFICLITRSLLLLICISSRPFHLSAQQSGKKSTGETIHTGIQLSNVKQIARLTGVPLPGESIPSPNNTAADYDVGGTDLGIMWQMGGSRIGIFFGDTNGKDFKQVDKGGGNGGNWRSNVLAFADDPNLDDGLTIKSMVTDTPGKAREICAGAKSIPGKYQTSIPTAAIRAKGVDYVHYMNIYEWNGGNGRWLTDFSSLYASYDNGYSWSRKDEVNFKPDSKFSQVCYAKRNGYVYMIGTLAGRGSAGYLARFRGSDILALKNYEYWNSEKGEWIKNNEAAATAVIPAPVGEASLLYHEKYKRWIIAYNYDAAYDPKVKKRMHAIVYRDAAALNGQWSDMKMIATEKEYPGLYSAYFHPLKNKGDKLYFTMSLWKPYNVYLMSVDVKMR